MGQKLHRGRRSVFRKRRPFLRTVAWILCAAVIVAGGYFAAMLIQQDGDAVVPTDTDPSSSQSPTSTPSTGTTQPTEPTQPQTESLTTVRGFYLPHAALTAEGLTDTLSAAKAAGFNGVVFDLKDTEGRLYYQFSDARAQQVNSFTDDALTQEQLSDLFATIKAAGLAPIPRLHAFQDNLGAKALADARITPNSGSGQVWYDGKPKDPKSRAWLNPYSDAAHAYISALAEELKEAGAAAVLLDSVQFPFQTSSAYYGTQHTDLKEDEVLSLFVSKVRQTLGEDCPVILSCTVESALGTATNVYGGNPLTFGANMASPLILPGDLPAKIKVGDTTVENTPDTLQATVKALVAQMILRTRVLEEAPSVVPILQAEGYTAAQVKAEIAGCQEGGAESYILYHPDGDYDFAAY